MPKRRKEASAPKPEESQRPPGDPADVASKEQCRVHKMFQLEQSQGKIYLSRSCFPSYVEDDIWAILQGCGFDYQTGGYRHDEMGISKIMNVDDIRELLLEKGIPADLDDDPDDEDDPDKVKRWIAFSHVPLKESDQEMLEETPLPSDYEALLVLCKLGFRVDGDTKQIYRGLYEQYDSIREIRAFLRSVDNVKLLTITDGDVFSPRKRARRATRKQDMPITDEELLTLRLWAATSPTPMRVFGQEYDVANVEDEAAPLVEIVEPEEEMEEEEEEPEEMDVEKEEEDEEEQSAPKGKSEVNKAATSPKKASAEKEEVKKEAKGQKPKSAAKANDQKGGDKKGSAAGPAKKTAKKKDVTTDKAKVESGVKKTGEEPADAANVTANSTPETAVSVLTTEDGATTKSAPVMPSMPTEVASSEADKHSEETRPAESSWSSSCVIS